MREQRSHPLTRIREQHNLTQDRLRHEDPIVVILQALARDISSNDRRGNND